MEILSADIETDGLLNDLTKIWCLAIGPVSGGETVVYADSPGYPPISEGVARLAAAERVVMHNGIPFDMVVINRFFPGTLRLSQIVDTLVLARLAQPQIRSHSLEAWGERLGHPKIEHSDWTTFSDEMAKRCAMDVDITVRLYRKLREILKDWKGECTALEHRVRHVIALQERNGFALDESAAISLAGDLRQERAEIEAQLQREFPAVWTPLRGSSVLWPWCDNVSTAVKTPKANRGAYTKGCPYTPIALTVFNPGSRQHIEARLRRLGWKPSVFTASGAAQLDEKILKGLADKYSELSTLARYFRLTKMLGQIEDGDNGWLRLVRNGRVYGSVNTNGAVTGRMTHRAPNMAQVDKAMRTVWTASPGKVLVDCDADGLEARMLAHYLSAYDDGAFTQALLSGSKETGTDIHSNTQRAVGLPTRDGAKTLLYAYLYGAGDSKLGTIVSEDMTKAGVALPKKQTKAALGAETRSKLQSGVTGLGTLTEAVRKAAKARGYLRGLDGRHIEVRSEHAALNTLLQSAGAIVMKKALDILHYGLLHEEGFVDEEWNTMLGFGYVANVHDEIVMECYPEDAKTIGVLTAEAIRLAGEHFSLRCPTSGSYKIGRTWADVH